MKILKVDRWALSLTHIATFMWPIWGPSGSCRPQVGPLCWPHQPCYQGYYVWSNPRHRDCCRCYRTVPCYWDRPNTLQWPHNEHKGFSNHWRLDCLLNRLFRLRSNKTLKLCVTCLCEGNSPVTGEFPAQVLKILSRGRQKHIDTTLSMILQLITWQHKEPGYQQQWHWPLFSGKQHVNMTLRNHARFCKACGKRW